MTSPSKSPSPSSASLRERGMCATWFERTIPAFAALRGYSRRDFVRDLAAGLTVAAVAVPQAMAYAQTAGIPPQYGLYTAIVMTAVGALLDSSRQLINGPTNAISVAVLSVLVTYEGAEKVQVAIMLALMVGAVQLGITLLRLGDLTRFISHAVIVGFTLGAGVLLVLDQLKNLLGLPALGGGEDHFLWRFFLTISHIRETNLLALGIGVGTVLLALAVRWCGNALKVRLPEFLLAMITMAFVVWLYDLAPADGVKGVPLGKVAVIGHIPANLPRMQLPEVRGEWIQKLWGNASAIALLGLLEAVAMAKAIASQTRQKLDINQQCLSEAVANIVGSLFQCFPGSGSLTRSNINQQAGAVSQWSGVFSAIAVGLTMIFFAPSARFIPKAALAGILLLSAVRLVNWEQLKHYLRNTNFDATIVWVTAISAVVISIEFCVMIGVMMSFVLYIPRAARVHLTELTVAPNKVVRERQDTDVACNRIHIYSLEGELFFGAAVELEEHFEKILATTAEGAKVIVLRLKRIRNPDTVCLDVIARFADQLHEKNVVLLFCGVRPDLMKILDSSGLVRRLGSDRVVVFEETGGVWSSTLEAIRIAYDLVGPDVCSHCPRRERGLNEREEWHFQI